MEKGKQTSAKDGWKILTKKCVLYVINKLVIKRFCLKSSISLLLFVQLACTFYPPPPFLQGWIAFARISDIHKTKTTPDKSFWSVLMHDRCVLTCPDDSHKERNTLGFISNRFSFAYLKAELTWRSFGRWSPNIRACGGVFFFFNASQQGWLGSLSLCWHKYCFAPNKQIVRNRYSYIFHLECSRTN